MTERAVANDPPPPPDDHEWAWIVTTGEAEQIAASSNGHTPPPAKANGQVPVEVETSPAGTDKKAPSQATKAISLAERRFELGLATSGEPFAVERAGPNIARMLRGSRSLRAELAAEFMAEHGHTASSGALADALLVLEGRAQTLEPTDVPVRVARHGSGIAVDLGRPAGDAVLIRPGGWEVVDRSPVLFRRTKLTGALPTPVAGGTIDELRDHINITEADWPMVVAWLVATLLPDRPCPTLLARGEQGTAKTTLARRLVAITDPSSAPVRSAPADVGEWAVTASASRVVGLDNLSGIPFWFSDALCRAVTGGGLAKRELYSDADLVVLDILRAIIITAIDAGSLRGDLADRLVAVELERIPQRRRRDEAALGQSFAAELPRLVGSLYTLTGNVLELLPTINPPLLPRMADFAKILAAVDQVLGTTGLETFLTAGQRLAGDVVDGDIVASAIRDFVNAEGYWSGAPSDLYKKITPDHPGKDWPKAAHVFSGRLKRSAPALREVGIEVEQDRANNARTVRLWTHDNGDASTDGSVTTTPASVTSVTSDAPRDARDASTTPQASPPDPTDTGLF